MKKVLFFLSLLSAAVCYGQSAMRLQHIGVEDGLSQSSVYSALQDVHGFIWFATGDGLNRYDGKEFTAYKSRLTDTLSGLFKDRNINSALVEDNQNRIWFTSDAGVCYFDERKRSFNLAINQRETFMLLGVDAHAAWAVAPGKGIYSIELQNLQCRLYPFTDKYQADQQIFTRVYGGINTAKGLWIVDSKGLLFFDRHTLRDNRVLVKDSIYAASLLSSGVILLSSVNGVWSFNAATGKAVFIPIVISNKKNVQWQSVAEDTAGRLVYIAEEGGSNICRLDVATGKYDILALPAKDIDYIYIDRSRNLWAGTDGNGAYKLDIKPPKFLCYAPNVGDNENFMVKGIYRDDSGMIWMGVFDRGLIKYDPVTGRQRNISPWPAGSTQLISTILKDSSGSLLVTHNGTMYWLDEHNGKIQENVELPEYSTFLSHPVIYGVAEWKKNHYLVGTNLGLYTVIREDKKLYAAMPHDFAKDSIVNGWDYNLYNINDGTVYVGKRNGFIHLRMTGDSTFEMMHHGFAYLPVRHFYKSKASSVLWLATEQGLIAYDERTQKHIVFDESSGLSNSYIYAILAQNDSAFWLSTNNGIFNAQMHDKGGLDIKARFVNYTSKDGLQSNEFNTGAYCHCSDGTFIFGGIAGINWFNPAAVKHNPYRALPALTGVSVNDTLFAADTAAFLNDLELPYTSNTIGISFRALEFTRPEQNMFAYKLEGLDKDWVYTANDKVRYSHLPPGNYRFLLKVRNNEEAWSNEPLVLAITIHPPYWGTWWFKSLMAIAVISLGYAIVRIYVHRKVLARTRELEKQHALNMERLRISKDVHDDIGSGLSKISLISALANKKLDANELVGKDIHHISAISKELVDNMRDLIWVLNPENTTLDNLISRMREYCADYMDGINIDTALSFPESIPAMPISREAQRDIFSTVKEAINNCVKHSGASEIKITLTTHNNLLEIAISDNGKGFGDINKTTGNGLRNMKQRIEGLGGDYTIISAHNTGTTIKIAISLDKMRLEAKTSLQ